VSHIDTKTRRKMRQIAHHLSPVVSVGGQAVTGAVVSEAERALNDHELIKIKIHSESRDERASAITELVDSLNAEVVQKIGKVVVLYRHNPNADPRLSNLMRKI
jgi:RNA-binding protein